MIKGLMGCSCHPFKSWKESDQAQKQIFKPGDVVQQRHTKAIGEVVSNHEEAKFYWIVKYGILPRDRRLEHSAELIKIDVTT